MKKVFITVIFFALTLVYLFPLLQGLILLPLDLLISNYAPWYSPGQILLKNPYMQDSIIQLFPWRHLVFQSLTKGIIPLWNPYQHMGLPFMASLKPMVFYPLNILFVFGEVRAWNALLFSQIFLSMVFAYMLARDFKLSMFSGILASFAFALSSLMIGLLEFGSDGHTLLWWPLLFLCAKRFLDRKEGRYLFFLGIILASCIFAGQLQYMAYGLVILIGFIFFYGYTSKAHMSSYLALFISIILGIGISAVQLLPSIELFSYSHRGLLEAQQVREVFTRGLITPYQLLRLLSPDFFGNPVSRDLTIGYIETSGYFGIVPFFFCLFAMFFGGKNKFVKFFIATFLIALALSLKGIGEILYFLKVPILTGGSGDRIFSIVLFSGAILSGFGLDEFLKMGSLKTKIVSLCLFALFFLTTVTASVLTHLHTTAFVGNFLHNIQFPGIILAAFIAGVSIYLMFKKKGKIAAGLFVFFIVGLTFFDLFRLGYRFLTFSNEKFFYPEMEVTKFIRDTSKDTLARSLGLAEPELGTYLNAYTVETYNPLYLRRSGIFLQSLQDKSNENLSTDNKYFLTSKGERLKHALDFLGVYLLVVGKDENPAIQHLKDGKFQGDYRLIYKDNRYAVYNNLTVNPRFGLYYHVQSTDDAQILKIISQEEEDMNFKKTLLLNENPSVELKEGTGSAKLLDSTVNSQKFAVGTTEPAFLYVSDTFYPGWNARVNNQDVKIYRANYNFRAVLVPKGNSIVEFVYMPSSFLWGIRLSIVSLVILIFFSLNYSLHIVNVKNIQIKRRQ